MSAAARSERLNLLVSTEEKASLERKATDAGLSLSELLRRGAAAYEPERNLGDLRALLREVSAMADRVIPEVDACLERMRAREEEAGTENDVRRRLRAELEAAGSSGLRAFLRA